MTPQRPRFRRALRGSSRQKCTSCQPKTSRAPFPGSRPMPSGASGCRLSPWYSQAPDIASFCSISRSNAGTSTVKAGTVSFCRSEQDGRRRNSSVRSGDSRPQTSWPAGSMPSGPGSPDAGTGREQAGERSRKPHSASWISSPRAFPPCISGSRAPDRAASRAARWWCPSPTPDPSSHRDS